MDSLQHDIERLNDRVLVQAMRDVETTPDGDRLNISAKVAARLRQAGSQGCRTAVCCGIPLVTLLPFESSGGNTLASRRVLRAVAEAGRPDADLAALNEFAMLMANRALLAKPLLARWWFGLTEQSERILREASLCDILAYARQRDHVVELRAGANETFWDRLLIGDVVEHGRARQISRATATLGLFGGVAWAK